MPTATMRREIEVRFTGSGSEYFRIWIVNLLLTLVTLEHLLPVGQGAAAALLLRQHRGRRPAARLPRRPEDDAARLPAGRRDARALFGRGPFLAGGRSGRARHRHRDLAGAAEVVDAVPPRQHQLARPADAFPRFGRGRLRGDAAAVRARARDRGGRRGDPRPEQAAAVVPDRLLGNGAGHDAARALAVVEPEEVPARPLRLRPRTDRPGRRPGLFLHGLHEDLRRDAAGLLRLLRHRVRGPLGAWASPACAAPTAPAGQA